MGVSQVEAVTFPSIHINHSTSGHQIIGRQLLTTTLVNATANDFSVGIVSTSTVIVGTSNGTTSVQDFVYNYYNPGSIKYWCNYIHTSASNPVFTAVNPSIGTVDSSGNVTYVSDGTANFNVTVNDRTKDAACSMSHTTNKYSTTFNGFVSTSTAKNIVSQMDAMISGLTASPATYDIYSAINDSTHTYTRNSGLFASSGVDMTAVPTYTSAGGTTGNGILVSPDIVISAAHVGLGIGTTFYFVTSTSTTVSRTVIGASNVGTTDIRVIRLDSPFLAGSGVTPAYVLPPTTFFSKVSLAAVNSIMIPVIFTNQFRTLKIQTLYGDYYNSQGHRIEITELQPTTKYYNWSSTTTDANHNIVVVSGDSGNALMTVVNGKLVALGTWHFSEVAPDVSKYITEIDSAISALGSAYSLTPIDLSGFASY